jgi:hypothetical protein
MDWMNSLCHFFLLMIIDDFDVIRLAVAPDKTQPPLIVNADAVLAEPITLQRLQVIAGRYTQKIQCSGGMQLHQLSQCDAFKRLEPLYALTLEQGLGIGALKRLDHAQ